MEIGNKNGEFSGGEKSSKRAHEVGFGFFELILRGVALLLTLSAAIALALDKQTKMVPFKISPDLPAFNVPAVARYSYVSAYVYFVVANSIACAFAAISLALAFATKGGGKSTWRLMIMVADLIIVALLFSSIGAGTAVGLIGMKGNSHLRWNKVCNVFGKFCHQVMASVALSLVGATVFVVLVILSILKLHKRL